MSVGDPTLPDRNLESYRKEAAALENIPSPATLRHDRPILRVGHRGAAGHAPENTLAAIHAGVSLGCDFVEVDVQSTRDGRLVLMHDTLVDRTTDGTGLVADFTWEELQQLEAGNGERIPSLEAALAAASGQAGIILEAKTPGIGPALHRAVQTAAFRGPVIYASFQHTDVLEISRIDPLARTKALIEWIPASGTAFAREAQAALVGLSFASASAGFIAALHDAGLEVLLYTVNEPKLICSAIALGADGIISDYPDRVPKIHPPEASR
jgi:glycerophosphoryl diester phosphodiesterase